MNELQEMASITSIKAFQNAVELHLITSMSEFGKSMKLMKINSYEDTLSSTSKEVEIQDFKPITTTKSS